jgi:hypothetical protein
MTLFDRFAELSPELASNSNSPVVHSILYLTKQIIALQYINAEAKKTIQSSCRCATLILEHSSTLQDILELPVLADAFVSIKERRTAIKIPSAVMHENVEGETLSWIYNVRARLDTPPCCCLSGTCRPYPEKACKWRRATIRRARFGAAHTRHRPDDFRGSAIPAHPELMRLERAVYPSSLTRSSQDSGASACLLPPPPRCTPRCICLRKNPDGRPCPAFRDTGVGKGVSRVRGDKQDRGAATRTQPYSICGHWQLRKS